MDIYRKIIIVCIILLTFYFLYRLWILRERMQRSFLHGESLESFSGNITPQNTLNAALPLVQYCVKGSLHSAYNRNTNMIDLNQLSTVLNRGVRFIDLEVYSFGGNVVVGYCSKITADGNVIESANSPDDTTTRLTSVFKTINNSKPPGITDPLFIQLRIKSALPAVYKTIVQAINTTFNGVLYSGNIDLTQPLSTYRGKTIIVIDKMNSTSKYATISPALFALVNLETGGTNCISTTHAIVTSSSNNILQIRSDNETINRDGNILTEWTVSMPNPIDTSNTTDIRNLIPNHGVNIALYRFDSDDTNLGNYEKIFGNTGFITMVHALQNINTLPTTF